MKYIIYIRSYIYNILHHRPPPSPSSIIFTTQIFIHNISTSRSKSLENYQLITYQRSFQHKIFPMEGVGRAISNQFRNCHFLVPGYLFILNIRSHRLQPHLFLFDRIPDKDSYVLLVSMFWVQSIDFLFQNFTDVVTKNKRILKYK